MAWLVLLASGFLLASVTTLDQPWLQSALVFLFLLTGFVFYKQKLLAYLAFLFVYPLLPSQGSQFSRFDFLEFVFLCVAFWWALSKIRSKTSQLPSTSLNRILALLITAFSLSMCLFLLRSHYVFSEVFLLKLRDSWKIFDSTGASDLIASSTFLSFLEGVLFFFITVDVLDSERAAHKSIRIMVYSAVLVSLGGILQYLFKFNLLQYWIVENPNIVRINSSFSDPNSLGTYLATILCATTISFVAGERKVRSYYIGFAAIMLIALLFTASRAAWAATFLTLMIAPVALKRFGIDATPYLKGVGGWVIKRGVYIALITVLLLFGAAALVNYIRSQPESLVKMLLFTFNPNVSFDAILKGRVELWKTAVFIFRDYPAFGSGPGSFRTMVNAPYFVTSPENAHNYFLQILAETGLPGFLLFCLVIAFVFREGRKRLRAVSDANFLLRYGLLAGVLAFLLTSLTGHPLLLLKLQLLFWGLIGMVIAQNTSAPHDRNDSRKSNRLSVLAVIILSVLFALQVRGIESTRRLSIYEYGYHPWERDEQGFLFRWTTLDAVSVLDQRGEVLVFQLRHFNPAVQNKAQGVRLYLNDQLLDTIQFFDNEWKLFKYFIPHQSARHRIKLRVVPEAAYTPPDAKDQRELGIGIQKFYWECAGDNPIGVYEQEREGEKEYYWTRGQASFLLNRSGNEILFRILPNPLAQTGPLDVHFYWDRQEIQKRTLSGLKWESINLRIPDGEGSHGVLTVRVPRTANLKELNRSDDSRDLGIRMELPFHWKGSVTPPAKRLVHPSNSQLFGVVNQRNYPFRISLFAVEGFSANNVKVSTSSRNLKRQSGLFDLIKIKKEEWTVFYPDQPFQKINETFVWKKIEEEVSLPSGLHVLRIKAIGTGEAGDVPIVRLKIDDREIARQPIVYGGWTHYYFPVELPNGGKKITLEFLNDLYLPNLKLDRNLMIAELAVANSKSLREMHEGWEIGREGLLVVDAIDRDFPFLPWSSCYTIEAEK